MKKDKYISLILLIVVIFGIAVRMYRLFEWLPWEPDVGRDMVVVKRMIQDNGPYNIQITSGSSSGFVVNSPLYYWITALLYLITHSPHGVVLVYAWWNVLGILFSYLIGKLAGDKYLGLLYALFVSSNYIMVTLSQKVWQQSILPTLTILNILLLQIAYVRTNVIWLLLLINASFLGLHFHVSFYPIFIVNSLWIAVLIVRQMKKKFAHGLLCVFNYLGHAALWLHIVWQNATVNPLNHIQWAQERISIASYASQINLISKNIVSLLFFNQNYLISLFIIVLTLVSLVYLAHKQRGAFTLARITIFYLLTILLLAFYPEPFFFGRLMIYYPLALLAISLVVREIIGNKIIQSLVIVLLVYLSSSATVSVFTDPPPNQIQKTEQLARYILQDYHQDCDLSCPDLPQLRVYSIENIAEESDWYTGQYWYFLEKISGRRLVKPVNYGNNLEPLIENPTVRYLICPVLDREKNRIKKLCVEEYLKLYNNQYNHHLPTPRFDLNLPDNLKHLYVVYKWSNK